MRILMTGASGLLGQELYPMMEKENWLVWGTNSKTFDVTNKSAIKEIMAKVSLDLIVHLAAFTDIDLAESQKKRAFEVNHEGTKNMALIAKKFDIPIIYISSDCVFDGKKSVPYGVLDVTNPISVYGESKLMGENEIRKLCKKYYIIRTSALYGKGGKNYVDTMLTFSSLMKEINVVDDQILTPTWTYDLSLKIIELIKTNAPYGIYHITSKGSTSMSEYTKKIFEIKKRNVKVLSVDKSDFPRPASRPKYSVMDNSIKMPKWEDSLEKYLVGKY